MAIDTVNLNSEISTSSIELASLKDTVTIRRDKRGIAYIEASNDEDLYFAQGYVTACDRLWQMDFLRRTARGELSEILGAAALNQDKLHRTYGFTRIGEALFDRASTQTRAVLESYARGVNAFIESCKSTSLPPEFHVLQYAPGKWTAVDSLALGKLLAESLSVTVDADILRALLTDLPSERLDALLPETSPLDLLIAGKDDGDPYHVNRRDNSFPPAKFSNTELAALTVLLKSMRGARAATGGDHEVGSNSWVVGGHLTASGKPLLSSDPHLPPTFPSIWHITHLSANGLRVSGVALPGLPGVMIGHNQSIAWGITNLCPDVQDLYLEKLNESDSRLYQTPAGWCPAEVHREQIRIHQPTDGSSSESVTLEVKVTRHGPIILESGSLGVALRWTALDTDVIDLETFLAINRARNWEEFVAALSHFGGPPQNFVYADTDGHIGYYSAGRIPLRKTGDGSLPYDGATDDGEWLGFIPFDEMPHVFDPPSGIIVTANQRLVGHDYPHHLTHNWRTPYRARRIYNLLTSKRQLTTADFLRIQGDTYCYPDVVFTSEVFKLAQPFVSTSPEWRAMSVAFEGWDGYSTFESTVLPLVTEMRKAFRRHILMGVLGSERAQLFEWRNEGTFIDKLITERPLAWLPAQFSSYEALVLACYREARNRLSNRLGPDSEHWTWGKLKSVHFPHRLEKIASQFAVSTFPQNTGGSMPTVNAGSRVSMRFVADLRSWDDTRLCLPLGQSGDPSSKNCEDQLDDWRNVNPAVLPFSNSKIADATQSLLVLRPTSRQTQPAGQTGHVTPGRGSSSRMVSK